MLKNRNLILLAVVLVVLGVISLLQKASHQRSTTRPATTQVLGGTFAADDLSRIEIGYGAQKQAVVLANQPDGWVVRSAYGHRANSSRVDNLLNTLNELAGEFRSDSPDVLLDYGFTDSTSVSVAAFGGESEEPVFSLEIGKKPDRSVGNFVKLPGSAAVYLTDKSILSNLGIYGGPALPESKYFLELEAHKCERLDVETITLHDGDSVIRLEKEFTEPEPVVAEGDSVPTIPEIDRNVYEWKLTRPHRQLALKTRADGVLGAVSTIRGVDIDDPAGDPASYGLATPEKRVEVTLQDGTTTHVSFGATREASEGVQAGVFMKVGDEPTVWVVSEYQLKNIFKTVTDLLPEEDESAG